jgi:hypothetical protein
MGALAILGLITADSGGDKLARLSYIPRALEFNEKVWF